ncbi:MAG: amidohydrolase [Steroidobacteraceae bacterium]|nr:amidohydrolase [Steroidobacteraceae bacterium]
MRPISIRICTSLALMCLAGLTQAQTVSERAGKAAVLAGVGEIHARMLQVNQAIWSYAEPGLDERRSSKELMDWLRENGFSVRAGVAGMPTAFIASFGEGKPVIAYLAEYDALLGVSQKAIPRREKRDDPAIIAGHGCGHSVYGTGTTAAAVALARVMASQKIPGTVRLYGTPAEETVDAKTYMLRDGAFDDVDVVLSWHTNDRTGANFRYSKAVLAARFTFEGVSAHASTSPEFGRSALDAVELMNVGVNYLREHVPEDTRIHYVVTDGGDQPNVVPARAGSWYYVRADRHDAVEKVYARIVDIARGAALMTGTEVSIVVEGDSHEVLPNRALAHLIDENLQAVGPPRFDEEDRAFARETQKDLGSKLDRALFEDIDPVPAQPGQGTASTDQGDLSWHVPTGSLVVASYAFGAPGHSWQVAASTGMSIGEKAMDVAARTLATTGFDLLTQPELLERARESFRQVRDPLEFRSLLPKDARAPESIR